MIGSAIQAFEELCPERIDLIHKNYRKLCSLLADVEEWGQVIILNMLTRYARTQFVDPNLGSDADDSSAAGGKEKAFYSSDEEESSDSGDDGVSGSKAIYMMDPDHRLLLKNAKPLLNSRNSAVIMAVVQLYYHCAPKVRPIYPTAIIITLCLISSTQTLPLFWHDLVFKVYQTFQLISKTDLQSIICFSNPFSLLVKTFHSCHRKSFAGCLLMLILVLYLNIQCAGLICCRVRLAWFRAL